MTPGHHDHSLWHPKEVCRHVTWSVVCLLSGQPAHPASQWEVRVCKPGFKHYWICLIECACWNGTNQKDKKKKNTNIDHLALKQMLKVFWKIWNSGWTQVWRCVRGGMSLDGSHSYQGEIASVSGSSCPETPERFKTVILTHIHEAF